MHNLMNYEATSPRHLLIVALTGGLAMLATAGLAAFLSAPFVAVFPDAVGVLIIEALYLLALGVLWDGGLLVAGFLRRTHAMERLVGSAGHGVLDLWRQSGFFSLGIWPFALVMVTSFAIIGSSNLTLINLELLKAVTAWRDPLLWSVEASLFEWLGSTSPDVRFWDALYHSAWGFELLAVFALILISRNNLAILRFCLSLILLFYVGRALGLLNPVMGPAFFQPQLFGYLAGSISGAAVQLVEAVMQDPDNLNRSAVLLGGVSAMPSLHLGMVALAVCWLAMASRWSLLITLPWITLVWCATVILGWHYVLDGLGGIALSLGCAWLSCVVLKEPAEVEPRP